MSYLGKRHAIKWYLTLLGKRFGPEWSRVTLYTGPYLDRFIFYVFGGTLRLHKFISGDDKRAPHDHPWWFVTFPFTSYKERYWKHWTEVQFGDSFHRASWKDDYVECHRVVKACRFHFRSANFRHIVVDRLDGKRLPDGKMKPFWTFAVSGGVRKDRDWGFWPKPDQYISFREWK